MSATALLAAIAVTVLVDGVPIDASTAASLEVGTVVAPLDPFVRDIAQSIVRSPDGHGIAVTRGERSIGLRIGSYVAHDGSISEALPIAPYVRAGRTIIPLAAVARALGASVRYDARAHVLHVDLEPTPLVSFTPEPYVAPQPGSVPTFAPTSTPPPRVTVTGIPRPRRTPILIEESIPQ